MFSYKAPRLYRKNTKPVSTYVLVSYLIVLLCGRVVLQDANPEQGWGHEAEA